MGVTSQKGPQQLVPWQELRGWGQGTGTLVSEGWGSSNKDTFFLLVTKYPSLYVGHCPVSRTLPHPM